MHAYISFGFDLHIFLYTNYPCIIFECFNYYIVALTFVEDLPHLS